MVVATGEPPALRVIKNDGAGGLSAYPAGDVSVNRAIEVVLVDMNRDGRLDFVDLDSEGRVVIGLGDGTGAWSSVTSYDTGVRSDFAGMAMGDVDGDGDLDVVCADGVSARWSWLTNDGSGALVSATGFSAPGTTEDVAVGDLNRDGFLDVVTFNGSGEVLVWAGPSVATFGATPILGAGSNERFRRSPT